MALDLPLLRCFLVLMEARSVSGAAARLDLTQPGMSHALARLRTAFGDPLLVRAGGGMVATARAASLEPQVREVLARAERLLAPLEPFEPRRARFSLVVTAAEYLEVLLLPPLLARLQVEAPGLELDVRSPDPERAAERLAAGEVDFRLGWVRSPPAGLRSRTLFLDQLVCIARQDHPALREGLTPEIWLSLPHARAQHASRTVAGQITDAAAARLGGKVRLRLSTPSYAALPLVVAASDAIATLPARFVRATAQDLPLQMLPPPFHAPRLRAAIYWHERTHGSAMHRWFRTLLAEVARGLP